MTESVQKVLNGRTLLGTAITIMLAMGGYGITSNSSAEQARATDAAIAMQSRERAIEQSEKMRIDMAIFIQKIDYLSMEFKEAKENFATKADIQNIKDNIVRLGKRNDILEARFDGIEIIPYHE